MSIAKTGLMGEIEAAGTSMNKPENDRRDASRSDGWYSRGLLEPMVLVVITALGIYLCYRLAIPFLPALAWALALAVLFAPLQRWLESKVKHPGFAAVLSILTAALILVVPVTFVGQRLVVEAAKGAEIIRTNVESGAWRRIIDAQPRIAPIAEWVEQRLDLAGSVRMLAAWLTTAGGSIVKGSVVQVIGFCLTFYVLFYFLRDRREALRSLCSLSPLSDAEMERLFKRVSDTIYASIYGTIAVAAVQGTLGGLMFWWLGLPAPLLWGVVMTLLAVVPVLGAFIVWIPAALLLALQGSWGKALLLSLWGGIVVGGVDNLLRPILVGNRLKLHTLLVFISVVGGLMLFGAAGLILGPLALTLTTGLLEIWRERTLPPQGDRV
jgi:predicted PurR-regulated permease PerM